MTIDELYSKFKDKDNDAVALFEYYDWYLSIAKFDPRTGDALPQKFSSVLKKVKEYDKDGGRAWRDRLWRIVEHAKGSILKLLYSLNSSPRREHAVLPLRSVRELDTASFIALSHRPGRNIREKLSGRPYMQAVRRFMSVDTTENRLLKAFAQRLLELLELRSQYLGEEPNSLISTITSWLNTDEANSIKPWNNLPPNNTLLSHRHYRAIYDSWIWLQKLDEDITADMGRLNDYSETKAEWTSYSESDNIFAEQPVKFDYDEFRISIFKGKPISSDVASRREIQKSSVESDAVCVDLTDLYPVYAYTTDKDYQSPSPFAWQAWKEKDSGDTIDIDLFDADAVYFHKDIVTVSLTDLFFAKEDELPDKTYLENAARAFMEKLKKIFKCKKLLWLQPDILHDIELEHTRRNINAHFKNAEPLPRSIAAVFEQIDYNDIPKAGYRVGVVEIINGKRSVTELIAKYDDELEEKLPCTKGFYWLRTPSKISDDTSLNRHTLRFYNIYTVNHKEEWNILKNPPKAKAYCNEKFDRLITIKNSPVKGGIKFYNLQQRVDTPLWRDEIPSLSIKIREQGIIKRVFLVDTGTPVRPIFGEAVDIPVKEEFNLPKGKDYYQFPLYKGDDETATNFSATLHSPAFPLKKDLKCRLKMTYTYGADAPYQLIFEPIDNSIDPIKVKWDKTTKEIITDAAGPKYPKPKSWDYIQKHPTKNEQEERCLLEWMIGASGWLQDSINNWVTIPISKTPKWIEGRNKKYFTLDIKYNNRSVFIHESVIKDKSYEDITEGTQITSLIEVSDKVKDRYQGKKVYVKTHEEIKETIFKDIPEKIGKRLYFPIITAWSDGRSVNDNDFPKDKKQRTIEAINILNSLFMSDKITGYIRNELLFLLSCLHKDTTDDCKDSLLEIVSNMDHPMFIKSVGFALGDVSQPFQKELLSKLLENPNNQSLKALSFAIWREKSFINNLINNLTLQNCKKILNTLEQILKKPSESYKKLEYLELLLGLLRLRDSDNEELKMLLQPNQPFTDKFANIVEELIENNIKFESRIQLKPQKPEGDETCDLLDALRLYLTNDDGANTIEISDIKEKGV